MCVKTRCSCKTFALATDFCTPTTPPHTYTYRWLVAAARSLAAVRTSQLSKRLTVDRRDFRRYPGAAATWACWQLACVFAYVECVGVLRKVFFDDLSDAGSNVSAVWNQMHTSFASRSLSGDFPVRFSYICTWAARNSANECHQMCTVRTSVSGIWRLH